MSMVWPAALSVVWTTVGADLVVPPLQPAAFSTSEMATALSAPPTRPVISDLTMPPDFSATLLFTLFALCCTLGVANEISS